MKDGIRPINYLGSKLRVLEDIKQAIDELDPGMNPVCDLFTGSGTVSNFLAKDRKVVSIDIQEYSRVLCSSMLNEVKDLKIGTEVVDECRSGELYKSLYTIFEDLINYEEKCISEAVTGTNVHELCDFLENTSLLVYEKGEFARENNKSLDTLLSKVVSSVEKQKVYKSTIILRYYGGIYFSFRQAMEMDAMLNWIHIESDEKKRDKYLAATLSAASDIVNTVGKQFAQPINPRNGKGMVKKGIGNRIKRDRELSFFEHFIKWIELYSNVGTQGNKVLREDYLDGIDKLEDSVKVIYADPPYTRYHYSRYYHVLETICFYDMPEISKVKINGIEQTSRGIYREDRHQSPFCIKSQAHEAFEKLFEKAKQKQKKVVLSYSPYIKESNSTPRLMSIEQIEKLAKEYFKQVKIKTIENVSHNKLNLRDKNYEIKCPAEVLIICE